MLMYKILRLAVVAALSGLMRFIGQAVADGNANGTVMIGVLGDMSGPYSTDFSKSGALAAVKMSVEDFSGKMDAGPSDSGDTGGPSEQCGYRIRQGTQVDRP